MMAKVLLELLWITGLLFYITDTPLRLWIHFGYEYC